MVSSGPFLSIPVHPCQERGPFTMRDVQDVQYRQEGQLATSGHSGHSCSEPTSTQA